MIKDTRREAYNTEQQHAGPTNQDNNIYSTINPNYLFSCRAVIKILEIVTLIIAMSCMVQYDVFWTSYPSNMVLFYVVVCLSWILQLAFFVMMIFSLEERVPGYHWNLCVMLSSVMETALLILVASLLANDARNHMKLEWKGENLTDEIKHYLNNLIAAVVTTVIASFLFFIDAIAHTAIFFKTRTLP